MVSSGLRRYRICSPTGRLASAQANIVVEKPSQHRRRLTNCCQCNQSGKCQKCSCIKEGHLCARCLPGTMGKCINSQNLAPSQAQSSVSSPYPSHQTLPPLHSIFESKLAPTLHHVPKSLRNTWSRLMSRTMGLISSIPSDLDSWCKFFYAPLLCSGPPTRR